MTGLLLILGALILAAIYASAWDAARRPRSPICGQCGAHIARDTP